MNPKNLDTKEIALIILKLHRIVLLQMNSKNLDTKEIALIILKLEQNRFTLFAHTCLSENLGTLQ